MLTRCILAMLKKDCAQHGKGFLLFFAAMFALAFVPQEQWRIGGMAVIVFTSGYYYAYCVYTKEVARRTMDLLLGLPVPPVYLIIAKFASVYAMALVTVNIPGALLLDARPANWALLPARRHAGARLALSLRAGRARPMRHISHKLQTQPRNVVIRHYHGSDLFQTHEPQPEERQNAPDHDSAQTPAIP